MKDMGIASSDSHAQYPGRNLKKTASPLICEVHTHQWKEPDLRGRGSSDKRGNRVHDVFCLEDDSSETLSIKISWVEDFR